MQRTDPQFSLRLATTKDDLLAAQRLRYDVFVTELGGDGDLVDHTAKLETDRFDPYFDHLVLVDETRDSANLDHVIGVYRLMQSDRAKDAGQFYTEDEYDLEVLKSSGRRLLELGRSCVHPDYRGGTAMYQLWNGLAEYVQENQIEILFGVASFHGKDIDALAPRLAYLYHKHLAPEDLRVRAIGTHRQDMNLVPFDQINRPNVMRETPALIKAYLRLGGFVGDGAFIDHAFNTTDVCLVMDTTRMSERGRAIYASGVK